MSIKKDIYIALQKHLNNEVAAIKWIDKQRGQINNLDNHVIPYPAVLIEFGNFQPVSIGKNIQKGPLTIRFHVLFENFAEAFMGSEDKDQALAYFDFVEDVHTALQGFSGDGFTALERTGEEEDNDHQVIIDTVLEYLTEATDNSSNRDNGRVLTANEITPRTKVSTPLNKPASNITSDFRT